MKEEIIQFQKVLFLVCLIAPLVLYFVASEMREYKKMQERKSKSNIFKTQTIENLSDGKYLEKSFERSKLTNAIYQARRTPTSTGNSCSSFNKQAWNERIFCKIKSTNTERREIINYDIPLGK
jgi:hypothetical protein